MTQESATTQQWDAIIVGAGFAGMYAIHRLRKQGLRILCIEAGSDVGGTWYWNRYPGARCDVPSLEYSFGFSQALEQDWDWPEVCSAQPDILRYANHVADRFDLRRDILFITRISAITYDEAANRWELQSTSGATYSTTYCIMATGCLSVPSKPDLPGGDQFQGLELHTGTWPKEPVDLSGKRVGVIGTGSSGVQAIPELARQAGHLTVFQRTPTYTLPANRKAMREAVQNEFKANYREIRARQQQNQGGVSNYRPQTGRSGRQVVSPPDASARFPNRQASIKDLTPDERRARLKEKGLGEILNFRDIYTDPEANEVANTLYREVVRDMLDDTAVADKLLPTTYGLGCKRQVLDRDYYDTYNRTNVNLISLHEDPIVEIMPQGIRTQNRLHELDVLIYATGFDAMTGALLKANITGRASRTLDDKWADEPIAYLGLQMEGFPNLFTITGPGSPSVLCNMLVAIEQHVDWIADCIAHLRAEQITSIEPTTEAEVAWISHVNEVAQGTMYTARSCNSWYLGANIPGKPRIFMPYVGGYPQYKARCDQAAANGYEAFNLLRETKGL